jgi:hypothetical protein
MDRALYPGQHAWLGREAAPTAPRHRTQCGRLTRLGAPKQPGGQEVALQIQNIMVDLAQRRATVNLFDPAAGSGDSINTAFVVPNLTGKETLSQAQDIAKGQSQGAPTAGAQIAAPSTGGPRWRAPHDGAWAPPLRERSQSRWSPSTARRPDRRCTGALQCPDPHGSGSLDAPPKGPRRARHKFSLSPGDPPSITPVLRKCTVR